MIKKKEPKLEYYRLDKVKDKCPEAQYYMIFGMRSNGKTFACLEEGIRQYCEHHRQLAIVRRWEEDFRGKRGDSMFSGIVSAGLVKKYTNGQWNNIIYKSHRWYFAKWDSDNAINITDAEPFAFAFALSAQEHDKSTSYENVGTIVFDEFISRNGYLPDEFVLWMNTVSTIVRRRRDVTIYMLGNSVSQFCPYFAEMGLKHIKEMKPGDIDLYSYGSESQMTVAVEYAENINKKTGEENVYFAFDNPKLKMITDGDWELAIYPHNVIKYDRTDIIYSYFIKFDDVLLQADVVQHDADMFTFIHRKTSPIKDDSQDLIYSLEYSVKPNYRRRINKPFTQLETNIWKLFQMDKVTYQDNMVGDIVFNYLESCV